MITAYAVLKNPVAVRSVISKTTTLYPNCDEAEGVADILWIQRVFKCKVLPEHILERKLIWFCEHVIETIKVSQFEIVG
jgi:hypothetical protein